MDIHPLLDRLSRHARLRDGVGWLAVGATGGIALLTGSTVRAQQLSSGRSLGLGALTAAADGLEAIDWNPARLVTMPNWQLSGNLGVHIARTNLSSSVGGLQSVAGGRRFLERQAVGFQLTPDRQLRFLLRDDLTGFVQNAPGGLPIDETLALAGVTTTLQLNERYGAAYAWRVTQGASLGIASHYHELLVRRVDEFAEYAATGWFFDAGFSWQLDDGWQFGLTAKNALWLAETGLPDRLQAFNLFDRRPERWKALRVGVAYQSSPTLRMLVDAETRTEGPGLTVGFDWHPESWLWVYQSGWMQSDGPLLRGFGIGVGYAHEPFTLQLGYLRFIREAPLTHRLGNEDVLRVNSVDLTPFATDQLHLTLTSDIGVRRQQTARIESVQMLADVFPAAGQAYAYRPLGLATVRNMTDQPIDALVSFYVRSVMDDPTETRPYRLAPGEVRQIPLFALFNGRLQKVRAEHLREAQVDVRSEPTPSGERADRFQTRLLIHGRNDWDGDPLTLSFFVTPRDPEILRFTRRVLSENRPTLDSTAQPLRNVQAARLLFDALGSQLTYVGDPALSPDRVQYPAETLDLHGGDCDDFSVAYAALLNSIGISAAFIEVRDPETKLGHLYLMFDTGLAPDQAAAVSLNEKRTVARVGPSGQPTVWLPVETTQATRGFETAWSTGALNFYRDTQIRRGHLLGWLRVIDVD